MLGGAPGFAVGAVAALASNLFFGQGPWTPWQMAAWGGVGLAGAGLARVAGRELGRIPLATACAVASLGFGAVMNLHLWVTYSGDHTAAKLAAIFATSLPFDIAHATGSALFCLAFGPGARARPLALPHAGSRSAGRPRPRSPSCCSRSSRSASRRPPRAPSTPTDAAAARASVRYLVEAQNDDGGWGGAPGQSSSQLYTGWTAIGLAAAGRNPRDVGSPSAVAYIRDHAGELNDLGEINRTIIVLGAAGRGAAPRRPRPRSPSCVAKQRRNGSFAGRVNTTAFAILGLRAAGRGAATRARVRRAADYIAGEANADGGFNFAGRGGPSGIDDTGAALQALVAAGRAPQRRRQARGRASSSATRPPTAASRSIPGGGSNAQSTAWAIQGLLAAGRDPAKVRRNGSRDPMSYLRSLTADDGAVRYSRTQPADAGVGHRAGGRRAVAQGAAARSPCRARSAPRRPRRARRGHADRDARAPREAETRRRRSRCRPVGDRRGDPAAGGRRPRPRCRPRASRSPRCSARTRSCERRLAVRRARIRLRRR